MAVAGPEQAENVLQEYADLAAIGTVADVMEMTGENRSLVRLGLKLLEHPRRLGLAALLREAGLEGKPVTSVSVGYTLAPRINASGRMGQRHAGGGAAAHRRPGPGCPAGPDPVRPEPGAAEHRSWIFIRTAPAGWSSTPSRG